MATINTKYSETNELASKDTVEAVKPVGEVIPGESERFAQLASAEDNKDLVASAEESTEELTLQELHQQFIDSTLRSGFNKTIEKAKEIIKEMKE